MSGRTTLKIVGAVSVLASALLGYWIWEGIRDAERRILLYNYEHGLHSLDFWERSEKRNREFLELASTPGEAALAEVEWKEVRDNYRTKREELENIHKRLVDLGVHRAELNAIKIETENERAELERRR